jgi:predicted metalloprotease with PDZ domain
MVGGELIALDGERLRQPEQFTAALRAGSGQELLIARRGQLRTLALQCTPPQAERYRLKAIAGASPDCLERQRRWLEQVV